MISVINESNFVCVSACGTAIVLGLIWLMGRMVHGFLTTSGSMLSSKDHQRRDGLEAMERLLEQLMGDPEVITRFHTNERRYKQALDAATDRTKILTEGQQEPPKVHTQDFPEDGTHE